VRVPQQPPAPDRGWPWFIAQRDLWGSKSRIVHKWIKVYDPDASGIRKTSQAARKKFLELNNEYHIQQLSFWSVEKPELVRIAQYNTRSMATPWPQVAAWPNDTRKHATYLSNHPRKSLVGIDSAEYFSSYKGSCWDAKKRGTPKSVRLENHTKS